MSLKVGTSNALPTINQKPSILKKEPSREFKSVQKNQERLKAFVDDLNDHIKWLLNRKQFMLQGRHFLVLQQLNETKKALALYEKGIRNLERQIEEDPKIRTMTSQIKFYDEYSNILGMLYSETNQTVNDEKQRIAEYRKILAEKRKKLNSKNHENIQLASQITKLRGILEHLTSSEQILPIEFTKSESPIKGRSQSPERSKSQIDNEDSQKIKEKGKLFVNLNNGSPNIAEEENDNNIQSSQEILVQSIQKDYFILKRKTETLVRKNIGLKKNILLKVSNFNEAYDLFLQAFHKYEDVLYKSQMVVHNQGLNGSLIFLLLNSKQKTLDSMTPVTIKDSRFMGKKQNMIKPFKKQQDGEVIDVIYSTFKKMLSNEEKKSDKVKEMVSSVQFDQLMTFTPLQVMGLVLLRPEALKDIIFEFDEKKKRLISLSMSLKNIKITEMK